jgi:hypothetical protein
MMSLKGDGAGVVHEDRAVPLEHLAEYGTG